MGDRRKLFFLLLSLLLIPSLNAIAADDPCDHVKKWKADIKAQAGVDMNVVCHPMTAALTWKIHERYTRHSGYPEDNIKYVFTESYPAYLSIIYDSQNKGKVKSFQIWGPMPQKESVVDAKLQSVDASLVGCYPFVEKCKAFKTTNPNDFKITSDPYVMGTVFDYNEPNEYKGSISESHIDLKDGLIKEPYNPRNPIPEYLTGITDAVRVEGPIESIILDDVKKAISECEFKTTYPINRSRPNPAIREAYYINGEVELKLMLGKVVLDDLKESINRADPDKYCPTVYSGTECYDISIDKNLTEMKINVKINAKKGKIVPEKHVETIEVGNKLFSIYVSPVTVGGKKPKAIEVSDAKFKQLLSEWEVFIEGSWNDKFKLKRKGCKGDPIKINIDAEFVSGGACHTVTVLPGEGRWNEDTWYAEDYGISAAHEFGHMLGLDDEYRDHKCVGRPVGPDSNVMKDENVNPAPRSRHFKPFAEWLKDKTGIEWLVVKN